MNAAEIAELNSKHGKSTGATGQAQASRSLAKSGLPANPRWTSRPTGVNAFQIFDGDVPVGEPLTPIETATVLHWLTGKL